MMTAPVADVGFREALRLFQNDPAALRDLGPSLETTATPPEPPRVVSSDVIESTTVRALRVFDPPTPGFEAFLDGTQESKVVHYCDGIPIVYGRVAAVVRQRVLRRMVTWKRPACSGRLYIPRDLVPATLWKAVVDRGYDPVNTTDTAAGQSGADWASSDPHPFVVAQRALDAVKRDRDRAERQLAEEWCVSQSAPLFIDGSIATSNRVAAAPNAIGVIKSHRTLYVSGAAMRVVQSLPLYHRSSVLRVDAYHRMAVASWYLRVRDCAGRDPMWGLLRVEMAFPDGGYAQKDLADRANLISRWILAELMPLSLPDSRWDKMVYGIRDCEEFLRSMRT
jgi:Ethanolamine utilization protein EutJ (predicted chaperonin)